MRGERLADSVETESVGDQRRRPDRPAVEEPERFGELVLIDHRTRECDFSANDREERDRRGLVGQSGEHDASARSHELERVRDRLGSAGGLHDEIHALPPGKPAGGVSERAVDGRVRRLGAELTREDEAPPRAAHDHHPGPPRAEHLEGQEPQRARPDDRGGLASFRRTALNGADDDGERLGEQQCVGMGGRRRAPAAMRRGPNELRESPVDVDADRGPRETQIAITFAAERALPARIVGLDDDRITRADPRYVRRDGLDAPDELVAHHPRVRDGSRAGPDLVVCPAQTCRDDADDDFAGLRSGVAHGLDAEIARSVEDRRFHRGQSTRRPTVRQPTRPSGRRRGTASGRS